MKFEFQIFLDFNFLNNDADDFMECSYEIIYSIKLIIKEKYYAHNISQQIISGRLLHIVTGGQKINFNNKFKLELITI